MNTRFITHIETLGNFPSAYAIDLVETKYPEDTLIQVKRKNGVIGCRWECTFEKRRSDATSR